MAPKTASAMPLFPTERPFEPAKALPDPFPTPFVSVAAIISQLEERSKVSSNCEKPNLPSSKTDAMAPTHNLQRPIIPRPTSSISSLHGMERCVHPKTTDGKVLLDKELPLLPLGAESQLNRSGAHSQHQSKLESGATPSLGRYRGVSNAKVGDRPVNPITPVFSKDRVRSRVLDPTVFRGVLPEPSPGLTPTSSIHTSSLSSRFPTPPSGLNHWNLPLTPPTPLSPFAKQLLDREQDYNNVSNERLSSSPAPATEYSRSQSLVTLKDVENIATTSRDDGRVFSTHLNIATLEAAGVRPPKEDHSSRRASSIYSNIKTNASFIDDDEWEDEDEMSPSTDVLTPESHQELVKEYRNLAVPNPDVWKEPGSPEEDVSGNLRLVPRPLFWDQPRSVQHNRLMGQPMPNSPSKSSMAQHFSSHGTQSIAVRNKHSRVVPSKRASAMFSVRPQSKYGTPTRHKSIKTGASHPHNGYIYDNSTFMAAYPSSPNYSPKEVSPLTDTSTGSLWNLIKSTTSRTASKASILSPSRPKSPLSPKSNGRALSPTYTYVTTLRAKPKTRRITPPRINTAIITNAFNSVVSSISPHSRSSSGESKSSKRQSKDTRSSSEKKDGERSKRDSSKTNIDKKSKFPNIFGMVGEKAENREREKRRAELKKKIQYVNTVDPNDQSNYQVLPSTGGWI